MSTQYDKLLVTHAGALRRKYAASGAASVRTALDALVAADAGRGLVSRVLLLDNATSMRAVGAAVVAEGDWVATVRAIDLACARYVPSYVAIVGARDVVPQARMRNPFAGVGDDGDPFVPGDLPFACDLPATWTSTATGTIDPGDLLAVTRVVGRIPDLVGATDPAMLLAALATATSYTQRTARSYQRVFALSASVWKGSTTQSVDLLPGPAPTVHLSPSAKSPWTKRDLDPRVHFVNCHGGSTTPDWFGQSAGGAIDTVALRPEDVDGRLADGTVVAAECCYGAMHLAPGDLGGGLPTMWAYLRSGAYAGFGSSTTAYGPADGNGQADLLCRYFLAGILAGASTGGRCSTPGSSSSVSPGRWRPEDLKTIAQFDLLGDPSLQPVTVARGGAGVAPKSLSQATPAPQLDLAQRRSVLAASGRALAAVVPRAGRPRRTTSVDAAELAASAGLSGGSGRRPGAHLRRAPPRRQIAAPVPRRTGAGAGPTRLRGRARHRRPARDAHDLVAMTQPPGDPAAPAPEILTGRVEQRLVAQGSKSEMSAVVLVPESGAGDESRHWCSGVETQPRSMRSRGCSPTPVVGYA